MQQTNIGPNNETTVDTTNRMMKECTEYCLQCYGSCLQTVSHCLTKGGRHAAADHISLLFNCARICQTSAEFMISGSHLHTVTCRACAEVCTQCADDCAAMAEDAQMKRCAEICRRCAESCRNMSAH